MEKELIIKWEVSGTSEEIDAKISKLFLALRPIELKLGLKFIEMSDGMITRSSGEI